MAAEELRGPASSVQGSKDSKVCRGFKCMEGFQKASFRVFTVLKHIIGSLREGAHGVEVPRAREAQGGFGSGGEC